MTTKLFVSSLPFVQEHADDLIGLCPVTDDAVAFGDCLRCRRGNFNCDLFTEAVHAFREAFGDPEWEVVDSPALPIGRPRAPKPS